MSTYYISARKIENYGEVVGSNYTGGLISNAVNVADVEGSVYVAGLFGYSAYATTSSLYNRGNIAGVKRVGGISGYNQESVTSSAYSIGKVDGDDFVFDSGLNDGFPFLDWEK